MLQTEYTTSKQKYHTTLSMAHLYRYCYYYTDFLEINQL